jgi:hypothetical protein
LGVAVSDIILIDTQEKTWNDTSLECITPLYGAPLTAAPVAGRIRGWEIVFKYNKTAYIYNTSATGQWILCSKNDMPTGIAQYRVPTSK